MDTATAEGMTIEPFQPVVKDGRMFGRGSSDTKAGGVAMVHAMLRIARSGEPPPISVMYAGVVDEEYRMRGAAALADALSTCGTHGSRRRWLPSRPSCASSAPTRGSSGP